MGTRISVFGTNSSISMVRVEFQRDVIELVLRHLDIGVGVDLVALHDVFVGDFLAGVGVDLGIFDAVAGLAVDLVEGDLFRIRRRRIQGDGQVTSERRRKPFQLARGAMGYSETQQTTREDTIG